MFVGPDPGPAVSPGEPGLALAGQSALHMEGVWPGLSPLQTADHHTTRPLAGGIHSSQLDLRD